MRRSLGRVLAILFIAGIIGFTSVPSLAAGLPASPGKSSTPVVTFIKITDGTGFRMVNTTEAPLVLDRPAYRYKPAVAGKPVFIDTDLKITADDVEIDDAIIGGDLYVYGNNARLSGIKVNGAVFIISGQQVAMDYCSILGNIEILDNEEDSETAFSGEVYDSAYADAAAASENNPEADKDSQAAVESAPGVTGVPTASDDKTAPNGGPDNSGSESDNPVTALLETIAIDDYNSIYIAANKSRLLPAGWKPKDLVPVSVPYRGRSEAKYMRREASDALTQLFAGAKKAGITLCAISGFRSYELQKSVFNKYTRQLGEKTAEMVSAKPGSSEHQTGLAIDISAKSLNYALTNSFANTREGKWLAENAAEYGFILRYPKGREAITGYVYEPWHFRYIGRELAIDITKKGLSLEEYYGITPDSIKQILIANR